MPAQQKRQGFVHRHALGLGDGTKLVAIAR
jgi:hypothetical protein